MPRPCCPRRIRFTPNVLFYKPAGIPLRLLEEVVLRPDELEAIRLADLEGLYHEEAGRRMGISRATFGRILEGARQKLAKAILHGHALRLETQDPPRKEPQL